MEKLSGLIYRVRNPIIVILLILIAILSFIFYKSQTFEQIESSIVPKYHFYIISQNSVDPFWLEIKRGIEKAAKQFNVAVEFNAPRFNNPDEELKYLDIALTSKVDGIITHVSDEASFTEAINQAYEQNIPVVTIENDAKSSNRSAFVGTNSFLLGKEAGELMVDATKGKAKIGIIISNDYALDAASQNLKINGFLSSVNSFPEMEVVRIESSKMGILSAEEIMQAILKEDPDIDAIYTTNSVDTLGSTQVIIDSNRVGEITLVGYGDTEDILRYIRKGVIYGTVMSDPYKMGLESVKALLDIKELDNTSTFIDTGVKAITMQNLQEYENNRANRAE